MHRHNTNFLGEKPIDSLQLMMDASNSNNGKITDEEIAANAFVFILAGYVFIQNTGGPRVIHKRPKSCTRQIELSSLSILSQDSKLSS